MANKDVRVLIWIARIFGVLTPILIGVYLLERIQFNLPSVGFPISFYTNEIAEILIFILLLILASKWPIAGGILYLLLWPFFFFIIALEHGMSPRGRGPSLLSTVPPLLAGVLFLVSGLRRRAQRKKAEINARTPAG